ncbi:hypothetical protein MBBAR_26c00070 [Methanobrevibacter arboriphilus JCM 13429 = DSM 1125]|uniref:Uncharacterized protein n=1 Tax=Methanobrevibacter arboriphilus JCM 13429 = DSM 1125 TaxID=1300164 RepID=A0A1V6N0G5_METAZ|nr:hypothetical protein [Methanobrevibacter arboriphilus]OQD58178.1 hypothetical protein MBBAR_26c00070 [Methanobrevibacter arboriphilus JCM 13429 = DSM 1125]
MQKIDLQPTEVLFLIGDTGTVGIVKVANEQMLFIGTPEKEEIVLYLEKDDLIAISAFGTGQKYEKAIKSMAYITREMESPIIVLPKDHPSSKRLKMVLSVGESVRLDCNITPGTHPEQDILCSCDSLSGLRIDKTKNGVNITGNTVNHKIEKL